MKTENTETKKRSKKVTKKENEALVEVTEVEKDPIEKEIDLAKKVMEWKTKYNKVFKTDICGDKYIWKPINRAEYIAISESEDINKDIETIRVALLYPTLEEFEARAEELAGLQISILEEILLGSEIGRAHV